MYVCMYVCMPACLNFITLLVLAVKYTSSNPSDCQPHPTPALLGTLHTPLYVFARRVIYFFMRSESSSLHGKLNILFCGHSLFVKPAYSEQAVTSHLSVFGDSSM